jgi:hypothetical protein
MTHDHNKSIFTSVTEENIQSIAVSRHMAVGKIIMNILLSKNFITLPYPYATLMKRSYIQENLTNSHYRLP